jgi:hypothetical protein
MTLQWKTRRSDSLGRMRSYLRFVTPWIGLFIALCGILVFSEWLFGKTAAYTMFGWLDMIMSRLTGAVVTGGLCGTFAWTFRSRKSE